MTESVIAEFKSVLRPHAERLDAVIDFAKLVQLALVHKTHGRNFLIAQSSQQLGGHLNDFRPGHGIPARSRKVIDGDSNLAMCRFLRKQRQSPGNQQRSENELASPQCSIHSSCSLNNSYWSSTGTLPRSTVIEALDSIKVDWEFAATLRATNGPSGSA